MMQGVGQRKLHQHKYGHLCQSLLDLQEAANTMFDVIVDRVDLEHKCLNNLRSRIKSAQTKVDAITGMNKAITIYSSSKYPVIPPDVEDFVPLFGAKTMGRPTEIPVAVVNLNSDVCQKDGDGTLELLQFFSETSDECWSIPERPQGIGCLPLNLKSISDALLFNSSELPYLRYDIVDNLAGTDNQSKEDHSKCQIKLPAPPQSVLDCRRVTSLGSEEFGFRPVLKKVPSFSLPSNLPDLPMVAETNWTGMNFKFERLPSIAPSAAHSRKLGGTNSSVNDAGSSYSSQDKLASDSVSAGGSTPPRVEASGATGPLNLSTEQEVPVSSSSASPTLPLHPAPPPPPPPQAPLLKGVVAASIRSPESSFHLNTLQATPGTSNTAQSSINSPLTPDSQRVALLASIRGRSFTLRKTGFEDGRRDSLELSAKENPGLKGSENQSKQRGPANLLAEMATTLKMRRLSMQGAAHDKEQVALKVGVGTIDEANISSPSPSSASTGSKFALPISKIHAYISRKNQEISDDDDEWDD